MTALLVVALLVALVLYAGGMTLARARWRALSDELVRRRDRAVADLVTVQGELAVAEAARPRVVRVEVGPGGLLEVEVNGHPLRGTVVTEARDAMSCARLLLVDLGGDPPPPAGPAEALLFALDDRAVPV